MIPLDTNIYIVYDHFDPISVQELEATRQDFIDVGLNKIVNHSIAREGEVKYNKYDYTMQFDNNLSLEEKTEWFTFTNIFKKIRSDSDPALVVQAGAKLISNPTYNTSWPEYLHKCDFWILGYNALDKIIDGRYGVYISQNAANHWIKTFAKSTPEMGSRIISEDVRRGLGKAWSYYVNNHVDDYEMRIDLQGLDPRKFPILYQ